MGRETSGRSAGPAAAVVRDFRVGQEGLRRRRRYRQQRRRALRKTARIRHVVGDAVADGFRSGNAKQWVHTFVVLIL